ncbi:MAG: hypothetical protein AAF670_18085 [Planctomycetota bacterium]
MFDLDLVEVKPGVKNSKFGSRTAIHQDALLVQSRKEIERLNSCDALFVEMDNDHILDVIDRLARLAIRNHRYEREFIRNMIFDNDRIPKNRMVDAVPARSV